VPRSPAWRPPTRAGRGSFDTCVHAAVVCPEQEPKRWFSWTWRWEDGLIDRLVDEGLLVRPEQGWLAAA
jgi:hypothetical protein